ncbi:hypothetical protein [Variovorax sp. Sphag1AA]|uniref:hypothetical protein n=1 Tax=Variovorax sp. Sphag1AA TaxID=2587027 RepID=UPI00162200EC|nr:hypothetical protein [Variovorax sp. Sphag1AA]MBB3179773.1 hypothetical protein [Variovorax sp. Sphag1AA]
MFRVRLLAASLFVATSAAVPLIGLAQAQEPTVRVRGVIEQVDSKSMTVKDRSGEVVTLVRPADMNVSEVVPLTMADIKPNSFVGAGATPQPDGTQRAVEVLVFPEAARGTGEGFRPWDYMPNGTMTNATVATLAEAPSSTPGGQKMVLRYKDGEQTVIVPPGTPIVTFKPGNADQAALVVPGAKVVVTAQVKDGKPTAMRMLVGRNGFTPPM